MANFAAMAIRAPAAEVFSPFASDTARKIRDFASLPVGWHYGSGRPPSVRTVAWALGYAALLSALGFSKTDAFPGPDGEVMVTGYLGKHCVQVSLEADGTTFLVHEIDNKAMLEEEKVSYAVTIPALVSIARDIRQECATSGLFTQNALIPTGANSLTTPLRGQPMEAVFQYSKSNVPPPMETRFANTLGNTTEELPANHPFFGSLMNPYYKQVGA